MTVSKDHSSAFAWAGILGAAVFIIMLAYMGSTNGGWQFGSSVLCKSDLSGTDLDLIFKLGCMLSGILLAVFGIGRTAYAKNAGHTAGGVFLIIGGIAFAFVGMFSLSDMRDWHYFVAVSAAVFILLAVIAIAAGNWVADRKILAGIGVVFTFMTVAMFFAYDLANLESYGFILAIIWVILESVNMIASSGKVKKSSKS